MKSCKDTAKLLTKLSCGLDFLIAWLHDVPLLRAEMKRCFSAQGIVFSVRPPKKSWKNIANLSGGEKTLSSLSLVFALHHYKPTPLYVMDEIDAALGKLHNSTL